MILASHDEARAESLATRVVTVDGGHITNDRAITLVTPAKVHP